MDFLKLILTICISLFVALAILPSNASTERRLFERRGQRGIEAFKHMGVEHGQRKRRTREPRTSAAEDETV
jgi:hypothetical protein